jgi:hypothetical protein
MKQFFAANFFDTQMFAAGFWQGVKTITPSESLRRGDEVTDNLRRDSAADAAGLRRGAVVEDTLRRS